MLSRVVKGSISTLRTSAVTKPTTGTRKYCIAKGLVRFFPAHIPSDTKVIRFRFGRGFCAFCAHSPSVNFRTCYAVDSLFYEVFGGRPDIFLTINRETLAITSLTACLLVS
jgi:hypothetical protein